MATILAIDDSPSMLRLVAAACKECGHEVILAENGKQGLDEAKSRHADLVLTDINMPLMDGITLIEALREMPDYEHTPILIMSAHSEEQEKIQGKNAGATGWLVKPISPERLSKAITKMLD
jgi:two-component system chemotaxis response regulator CheY